MSDYQLRKFKKDEKDERGSWLKRKWGTDDVNSANACETTRKTMLEMLLPRWDDLKGEQKKHFEWVLRHDKKWKGLWDEENQ